MAKPITIEELKKENAKLKRIATTTADKLHQALNAMQPLVADSKDDNFIRCYERGRDHVRRNFNLGTDLKKKTKKGKKLNDDEMFFESLPCEGKTESLFQMMRTTYKDWIINRLNIQPTWEGREFGALKSLQKVFLGIAIIRGKAWQADTGAVLTQEMIKKSANASWGQMLNELLTDKVSDFLKSQKKLSQIQYNLTNIIDQLKNGTPKKGTGKDQRRKELDEAERELAMATGVEQSGG